MPWLDRELTIVAIHIPFSGEETATPTEYGISRAAADTVD